jgi:parallel beta-helix repeat protein
MGTRATAIFLIWALLSVTTVALRIRPAGAAGTVYILPDGSIDPPFSPIVRNGEVFTLVDNIGESLVVQRNGITLDGAGHLLLGSGQAAGVSLHSVVDVTVIGLCVSGFTVGIDLSSATSCIIAECQVSNNLNHGIQLAQSAGNHVLGSVISLNGGDGVHLEAASTVNEIGFNSISNCTMAGVNLHNSTGNTISNNHIAVNAVGITTYTSDNSSILGNLVEHCPSGGVRLQYTQYSIVAGNTIVENGWNGIFCGTAPNNMMFLNNLVDNFNQVLLINSPGNWDSGYPIGGNYWSDDAGEDLYRGPYQNETGHDGISDYPYYYNDNPLDHYPLMGPFGPTTGVGDNVTVFPLDTLGLVFDSIIEAGETFASRPATGYSPPAGHTMLQRYDIQTTAMVSGDILLRIIYGEPGESPLQSEPQLFLINGLRGDVDYDFDIDIFDLVYIAGAYGTTFEDPAFRPNADVDRDGDVDIFDIVITARNYGTSVPEEERYVDITTHVDAANHVIFGVAPHLSIFGVTRAN